MYNKITKISSFVIVAITLLMISFSSVYASSTDKGESNSSITDSYGNGEYAITKYDFNMKVNENNSFDISENITS